MITCMQGVAKVYLFVVVRYLCLHDVSALSEDESTSVVAFCESLHRFSHEIYRLLL